nr:MAG TPA: Baseplate wedge protein [Caudoviricetes sp.]
MPEYGITETGLRIKRFDTILSEINAFQTEGFGVQVGANTRSFLNTLNTSVADKIAELWELGADIYHNLSPMSAEGAALDNAVQFGGNSREKARSTYYPIHCECTEGITLDEETLIESDTNPAIKFLSAEERTISRSSFNKAKVKVVSTQPGEAYTVALNGTLYSYTCKAQDGPEAILGGLRDLILADEAEAFTASVDSENVLLIIEAADVESENSMLLTDNLTTESVTAIISFASEEPGEVSLPNGAITKIVTAPTGFLSCTNLCGYVAGRLLETDVELRQSYVDKIFSRSSRMTDSIRSAILANCAGVTAAQVYENRTNETDSEGRPPHSVEAVVDGGSNSDIAEQILATVSAGITTYGSVSVDVPGEDDDMIEVCFNRPTYIYCWFKVTLTISKASLVPANYAELVETAIVDAMSQVENGEDVVPQQQFLPAIYEQVPGISYIDVSIYTTTSASEGQPSSYPLRSVEITNRQRAMTSSTRIEVALDD